ncbi:MAG: hypothetical protein JNM63_02915, partial [Spirochaetia bacterium]|nr:hypothetical protein [Spirochaetia bacterium]
VLNLILDYLLIFGKGGFPAMGIEGAAIATFVATVVNAVILFGVFITAKQREEYATMPNIVIDRDLMGRLLRFGTPAGFQFFIEVGAWGLLILFLGRLGEASLMAVNISISIESFAFMPAVGLATAASILVGQARGNKNFAAVTLVLNRSIRLIVIYEAAIMILFLGFPSLFVAIFSSNTHSTVFQEAKDLAVPILRLTGLWLAVDAVRILLSHVLKTLGETVYLMTINVIGAVFLVVGSVAIALLVPKPLPWIWVFIIAWVVGLWLALTLRFRSGKWRSIQVIEETASH